MHPPSPADPIEGWEGMGVAASSSSWSAGLRNGVRSSPSVAAAVPVAVAGLELRGVAEL